MKVIHEGRSVFTSDGGKENEGALKLLSFIDILVERHFLYYNGCWDLGSSKMVLGPLRVHLVKNLALEAFESFHLGSITCRC